MAQHSSRDVVQRYVIALAVIVAAGIFFRLYHADWKVYSFDETVTSVRASGHTFAQFQDFVHDGRPHHADELARFQGIDRTTNAKMVWNSLATEDPQHPPLYFLLTRYAEAISGDSLFYRRLPAIAFGILGIGAAWWLARELFRDRLAAWCFAALVAVSPFHVTYAQQAREYSLWMLLTCLSSAILLRAIRTDRVTDFALFALTVVGGLWTFPFFALVLVAQIFFVLLPLSATPVRARTLTIVSVGIGAVSFIPWIAVMIRHSGVAMEDTSWTAASLSPLLFAGKWLFNLSTVFFDLDFVSLLFLPVSVAILAVAAWFSLVFLRKATPQTILFVALLGGFNAAALLVPDLVLHQTRSVQGRYLTPLWIAIELATAFGIASTLRTTNPRLSMSSIIACSAIFFAGIASCATSSFAHAWWLASGDRTIPAVALELAREEKPTLVYVDDDDELLELAASRHSEFLFFLHPVLDDNALRSARHPFVLTRQTELLRSSVGKDLFGVEVIKLFPFSTDPLVALLRRRAAGDRGNVVSTDLALYSANKTSTAETSRKQL